jgi:hypothetical protein
MTPSAQSPKMWVKISLTKEGARGRLHSRKDYLP